MRRLLELATAAALVAGSITLAAPAKATTLLTLSNCQGALDGQTLTIPTGETDFNIAFSSGGCTVNQSTGSTPALAIDTSPNPPASSTSVNIPGELFLTVQTSSGSGVMSGRKQSMPGGGAITGGPFLIYFSYIPSSGSTVSGSFTIVVGGGGGSDSSAISASAPVLETLTIQTTTGNTTCTGGSPTGYRGEWMTLPLADACSQTGPDANPNAKLLGWATNPNFPESIAQRQVDNGWGAYETFNEDGQMTGVFIPAGGATFVSASTNLYPIWSS